MSETTDLTHYVRTLRDGTERLDLVVDGMTCAACIVDIENALNRSAGVIRARVNYSARRLSVDWQARSISPETIVSNLSDLGYRAYPFLGNRDENAEAQESRRLLRYVAVAAFAAMNVMLLSVAVWSGDATGMNPETRDFLHWISALVVLPAAAYAGRPFFENAWSALRHRRLNMDVPISLGILLALGMSLVETQLHARHAYFDSAIMLIFFLLTGRYFDNAMRSRTRAFAANLAALRAPSAARIDGRGEVIVVPAETLSVGDLILSRAGERIPVDGVILSGRSELDESFVTGETRRRHVGEGDLVCAGTLNYSGSLRIEVTHAGGNTSLDDMQRLIEAASLGKTKYMRLGDRAARLYAPVVHAAALLTCVGWLLAGAAWHDAIVTAIAVLIITCPCALALAIPAVQVVATGKLFRSGILLNTGNAIETFADIDTVIFDKTGTLTQPDPTVSNAAEIDPDLLERAARLALSSHHPLARTLAAHARLRRPYESVIEEPGQGVRSMLQAEDLRLGSPVFCSLESEAFRVLETDPDASIICVRHGKSGAVLRIRQELRRHAAATIAGLRDLGLQIEILSGDRQQAVAQVARQLNIATYRSEARPAEKAAYLQSLAARGRKCLMVGDGINDAPALACAHASLSPISASDIAQSSADAVFLGESLDAVVTAITTARRAKLIMRQNLFLAVAYNAVAVPLAICGLATPLIAAIAMSGSSILVTVNALRAGAPGKQGPAFNAAMDGIIQQARP